MKTNKQITKTNKQTDRKTSQLMNKQTNKQAKERTNKQTKNKQKNKVNTNLELNIRSFTYQKQPQQYKQCIISTTNKSNFKDDQKVHIVGLKMYKIILYSQYRCIYQPPHVVRCSHQSIPLQ